MPYTHSHDWFNKLEYKHKLYVLEYCKTIDNASASRACGHAPLWGRKLLATDEVAGAIAQKMSERVERLEIDGEWVLTELLKMYNMDMSELYDNNNCLLPIHDWPEHWRKSNLGVKSKEIFMDGIKIGETMDVKLPDKKGLLELVGKHINVRAFTEQIISTSDSEITERLNRGRERMAKLGRSDALGHAKQAEENQVVTEVELELPVPVTPVESFL